MRPKTPTIIALSVLTAPWLATPALAQAAEIDAAITPERIVACSEDRRAEGCATLLIRLLVCESAPELPGCAEINAMVEEVNVAAEELETEVEPRAEGELADDETADAPLDEDAAEGDEADAADEDADEDADAGQAIDDAADTDAADED